MPSAITSGNLRKLSRLTKTPLHMSSANLKVDSFATSGFVDKFLNAECGDAFAFLLNSNTPSSLEVCLFDIIWPLGLFSGWITFMFEGENCGFASSLYGMVGFQQFYLHLSCISI